MEHFEYVKALVGIDHVGFGPDTVYGDHVGLHRTYMANLSIQDSRGGHHPDQHFEEVEYVEGLENPTEGSINIVRWLVNTGTLGRRHREGHGRQRNACDDGGVGLTLIRKVGVWTSPRVSAPIVAMPWSGIRRLFQLAFLTPSRPASHSGGSSS